jgi:hypothetical protein
MKRKPPASDRRKDCRDGQHWWRPFGLDGRYCRKCLRLEVPTHTDKTALVGLCFEQLGQVP